MAHSTSIKVAPKARDTMFGWNIYVLANIANNFTKYTKGHSIVQYYRNLKKQMSFMTGIFRFKYFMVKINTTFPLKL